MSPSEPPGRDTAEFWRDFLSGGHSKERAGQRRQLELRGKQETTEVVTLSLSPVLGDYAGPARRYRE